MSLDDRGDSEESYQDLKAAAATEFVSAAASVVSALLRPPKGVAVVHVGTGVHVVVVAMLVVVVVLCGCDGVVAVCDGGAWCAWCGCVLSATLDACADPHKLRNNRLISCMFYI